jgi:outer membrane protein assembly factor BamB
MRVRRLTFVVLTSALIGTLAFAQPGRGGSQWLTALGDAHGPISGGAVVALRLVDAGGAVSLAPGWVSHTLEMPATPLLVNGVAFTLSTGLPRTPAVRGAPAVLHAYDATTGKPLWNSGKAISTFASPGSMWSGLGQVYVGTHDGTLYAFGFNDERRHTNGG